jgi:hypothetical protein
MNISLNVPSPFPRPTGPVTLGRVGEFRRMTDSYNRVNQGGSAIVANTSYTQKMANNVRMVKARIHSKIDLIG